MAGDFPPESGEELTGIVRGDIGDPLSSPDLTTQPDLATNLSPWESPLRQAASASQLRARPLPSSSPTRAAEPEKPVTPSFAVWRSPASFGSPRVQSDVEAPSPVVSGVQEGLVRRATQPISRAVLGAGAVDGLLATRDDKKPPTREPWQEPLVAGSTCSGKTNAMGWSPSLAEWDATASCGCSSCGGPSVPETRKDAVEINLHAEAKSSDWMSTFTSQNICPFCGNNKSHEEFHQSDFYKKNILGTFRRFVNMGRLLSTDNVDCMDIASYNPPAALAEIEKFKTDASQKVFDPSDTFNSSPNAQPRPPGGTDNYISNLFRTSSVINDPGINLRHVHGVIAEKNIRGDQEKFRTIFTRETKGGGQNSSIVYNSKEQDELWKFGVVKYFFFDPNDYGYSQMESFTKWPSLEKNLVLQAMKEWEDITNGSIRFVEFPIGVQLMYAPSIVRGSAHGAADLKVGPKPTNSQFLGTARHELGHIIGLAHEQQRADLSTFIQVLYTPGGKENFQYALTQNIIGPFNPRSLMMYGSTLQSCLIEDTEKACYLCQPQWIGGDGTTVPNRLFCPFPFTPGAYASQYASIKNKKINNLKIQNGFMSGGYIPNQPYSIIPDPTKFLTLLDGSGVIELYRWAYYNIIPFFPLFDHFKNNPDLGSQAEYLTNGDSINNVNSNSSSAFINNTQIFGSPSVVYADNGDIFVVVTAKNSQIYVRRYNSKTQIWNPKWDHISSNFPIFSEPTAVISDGILVIFATDTKGVIRFCGIEMIQDFFASTQWFSVNINMSTTQRHLARPAVVRNPNGGFEIFAYTPGNFSSEGYPSLTTCHVSTNNNQVQITGLQKSGLFYPTSSPAAAIAEDGSIVICIFGFDGTTDTVDINNQKDVLPLENPNNTGESVWVRTGVFPSTKTNPIIWKPWDNLPGQVHLAGSNPTIGISNNKFSIYVRGKYGHLIRRWFSNKKGWDDFWWDLGGILASDPNAAKNQIFALTGENLNDYFSPVTSDPSPEDPISTLEQNLINAGAVEPRALKIVSVNDITTLNLGIWYKQDNLDDSVLPFDLEGGGGFL